MSKASLLETVPPEIWLHIFETGCNITQHDLLGPDLRPCRLGLKPFARLASQTCTTWRDLVTSSGVATLHWDVYSLTFAQGCSNSEMDGSPLGVTDREHDTHDIAIRIKQSGYGYAAAPVIPAVDDIAQFLRSFEVAGLHRRVVAIHIHLEDIQLSHNVAAVLPRFRPRSRGRRVTLHFQTPLDKPQLARREVRLNYNTAKAFFTLASFSSKTDARNIELVISDPGIFVPPELNILQITVQHDFFRLSLVSVPEVGWSVPQPGRRAGRWETDFIHQHTIRTSLVTGQEDYVMEPTSFKGLRTIVISRNDTNHTKLFMGDVLGLRYVPNYLMLVELLQLSRMRCDQPTCDKLYVGLTGLTHLSLDLSKVPYLCLTTLLAEKEHSVLPSLECIYIATGSRTARFLTPEGENNWSEHTTNEILDVVNKVAMHRKRSSSFDTPLRSIRFDFTIELARPDLVQSLLECGGKVWFAPE